MSSMLYILGARLAAAIEKEELICRGMLRLAIEDGSKHLQQTRDHKAWKDYLNGMNFRDWDTVLQGEALSQRLVNVGVKDSARVVATLRQTLVEKQSLLTMSTH